MATHKSSRVNRKYKTQYRVRNWSEYERGLIYEHADKLIETLGFWNPGE